MESILTYIKSLLGPTEDNTDFDIPIIALINGALSDANLLGVGPPEGFSITDKTAVWYDFIGDRKDIEFVKTYIWHKVRLQFDPPQMGYLVDSIQKQIDELAWKINVVVENEKILTH